MICVARQEMNCPCFRIHPGRDKEELQLVESRDGRALGKEATRSPAPG